MAGFALLYAPYEGPTAQLYAPYEGPTADGYAGRRSVL